jgi:hypothetical protein
MATANYNSKQFSIYLDSEKAWEVIEKRLMGYDIDVLDELYPDDWDIEKNATKYQSVLDKMLFPKEEYKLLEGKLDGYCVTSLGRVLNVKHPNQVIVYFAKGRISTSVRNIKIFLAAEFVKMNWEFNIDNIKHNYDKYK